MFVSLKTISRCSMSILFVMLLVACKPQASPLIVSDINVSPSTAIHANETASLTISASGADLRFRWTASRGEISSETAPSVIYTAPNTPGTDTVTVEIFSDGQSTVRSITFIVASPPTATPLPSPTATETPLPTETSSPTSVPDPIACLHPSITGHVFQQLSAEPNQVSFYGPLDQSTDIFLCQGVYDVVYSTPVAVRIEYHSVESLFGFWGIGTPEGFDASGFREICFWAYTEQPNQAFRLKFRDLLGVEKGVRIVVVEAGQWTQICKKLSEFVDQEVQLDRLENINLGFEEMTGSATVWVDDFELKK